MNFEPKEELYKGWHSDAPWETFDGGMMPLWRFAIYFRDYTTHRGGLGVVPGSHLGPLVEQVTHSVAVQSRPGDLVVWNLRTLHRAGMPNGDLPIAAPRNAIFFDYAAPGDELDRYVAWRAQKRAAAKEST